MPTHVDARGVAKATRQPRKKVRDSNAFGVHTPSRTVACSASDSNGTQYGISDAVVSATNRNRREAAREMARWKRTLPKGVRI